MEREYINGLDFTMVYYSKSHDLFNAGNKSFVIPTLIHCLLKNVYTRKE